MEKWEREVKEILEGEKVFAKVLRVQKQKEQEIEIEQIAIDQDIPRRWRIG